MKITSGLMLSALLAILLTLIAGCGQKAPQQLEKIVLGTQKIVHSSPVWIAEKKGYFQEEGLKVEIKEFDSGRTSLKALLNDKSIDLTTTSQSPVVYNSFKRDDFAIIGGMVYSDKDIKVLVRQDKGIKAPQNLKGRILGITAGTAGPFYLGLFLTYHNIPLSDIKMADMEPTQLAQALIEGQVDAIITWEPYIYRARKALGDKALLFPGEGLFRDDVYFIAGKKYLKDHPEALKRFLRAIEKADEFIRNNRNEAMEIVGQKLKMDKEDIAPIWNDLLFKLFMDQSILISLEAQARWAIRNKLTGAATVPNYLNYIYPEALKAVSPEAVYIAGK
jgi:NitT/TauT family transport system substrate-binding protein